VAGTAAWSDAPPWPYRGGCSVPEGGCSVPEGGCSVPEGGCSVPEGGCSVPEGGCSVPEGGCCASSGRLLRLLRAAAAPGGSGRRVAPKGSADPQAALPRPRVLEPAASQAADVLEPADAAAFDRPGVSSAGAAPGVHVPALGAGLACGAAHLAWQLRTVDFHSRADCLRKFQPGRMSTTYYLLLTTYYLLLTTYGRMS
jgi:hypothetical protein